MSFLYSVTTADGGLEAEVRGVPAFPAAVSGPGVLVPAYGLSLVDAVLEALREAATSVPLESFAAERVQSTFRMYTARTAFLQQRRAVVDIQRVYRGWRERRATLSLRAREEQRRDVYMFHYYATRIQAVFRGYASRTHHCDFYARKAYVDAVTEESEAVRTLVNDFHEEQLAIEELQTRLHESQEYTKATAKVHHLLSTATVSGVYRRPLAMTGTATTFGTNVEEDIRQNTSEARRPVIEAEMRKNAATVPVRPAASTSTRAARSTAARTKATTPSPPPAGALDVSRGERGPMTPPSANGVGLAATLPPIRGHRTQATPKSGTVSAAYAPSCAWENQDARPAAKALVEPDAGVAKVTLGGKAPRRPTADLPRVPATAAGLTGASATSSFDKQFKVASHNCGLGEGTSTTLAVSQSAQGGHASAAAQSTYDTETAALQRSVDAKVMKSVHGEAVFKVRAQKSMM